MKRTSIVLFSLVLTAVGCSSSPGTPSGSNVATFTAELRPSNEVPPVGNAESTGSGNVSITFNVTRDAQNNVTAGTATFVVTLTGFPAGTPINIAHIHQAAAGTNGAVVFSTQLTPGDATILANGSGSFIKTNIVPQNLAIFDSVINNPAGFYFNVHSTLNPAGVARGQLVRVQ